MSRIAELEQLASQAVGRQFSLEEDLGAFLELAIELSINIEVSGYGIAAVFLHPGRLKFIHLREDHKIQGKHMAVRMALLRAAAEIGRFK